MIQLTVKKSTDSCNFCKRRDTLFELTSSEPSCRISVRLCRFCANHLGLACQSIKWNVEL
jgi:hypothetical protein